MATIPLPTLFGILGTLLITGIYHAWVRRTRPEGPREVVLDPSDLASLW